MKGSFAARVWDVIWVIPVRSTGTSDVAFSHSEK